MIAEPTERRSSKRYSVETDRAEVSVRFAGADHEAVMADMSGSGFGLLLMKGSHVDPGQLIRLTSFDGNTVFDLEVVHVRMEDVFQHVGLRRLNDENCSTVPLFRRGEKSYSVQLPGASPLIFIGTIVGFSATCIGLVEIIRPDPDRIKKPPMSAHQQALADAANRLSPEEKRQRILERTNRHKEVRFRKKEKPTPNFWTRLTGPDRKQMKELVGSRDISWHELVRKLELSTTQQNRILTTLINEEPIDLQLRDAREEMISTLTSEQLAKFNQLLATLPIQ